MTIDLDWLSRLRSTLEYDAETGIISWKKRPDSRHSTRVGTQAGARDSKGHRQIRFESRLYLAHRLAWVMTYGRWPVELDHINRQRDDNRLANLRECSHAQNSKNLSRYANNTSGHTGVSFLAQSGRWLAYINSDNKRHSLGRFATKEEAVEARKAAEKQHHGDFAAQASAR